MSALLGKVAFITGAGSGIGRGTALRLAREGADICIPDIDQDGARETADYVTQLGRRALVLKANVASQVQIQKAALGERHADVATSLCNLGSMCDAEGKYADALVFYEQALEIYRATLGDKHVSA